MHARIAPGSRLNTVILLAIVLAGCAGPLDPATRPKLATGDGAEPATSAPMGVEIGVGGGVSQAGFYPLQIGNRWVHQREEIVGILPAGGDAPPTVRYLTEIHREILCAQPWNGVDYLVESAIEYATGGTFLAWRYMRQNATGLYERDVLGTDPPPCQRWPSPGDRPPTAPAGLDGPAFEAVLASRPAAERAAYRDAAQRLSERLTALHALLVTSPAAGYVFPLPGRAMPGELTRLRYPLQRKARWLIRDDPEFPLAAEVVGLEALDLPAGRLRGYRIRLRSPLFGPQDVVDVWYGRSGYLQLVGHFELDAVDQQGNFIGLAVVDERETLEELSLARPGLVAYPPRVAGTGR